MKNNYAIALILLSTLNNHLAFADDKVELTLQPHGHHEECFYIDKLTTLTYQYKAQQAVEFNLHYHDANGMNYLKQLSKSTEHQAKVNQLTSAQVHCLMWENSSSQVIPLSYQFKLEK